MTTSYRDRTADLLRAIALFLLFAAHTSFTDSFQNIREFDVPLLFFLSGMSYVYSIQGSRPDQKTYLLRRFRKLILRVWIFLTFFFLFFNGILHSGISSNVILNSFLMTGSGIMFVWVYRVFFFNCITLPILQERTRKMPAEKRILIGIAALAVNDLIYRFLISPMQNHVFQKLLTYLFSDTVGFTVLAWFGASYPDLDEKGRIRFTLLFLVFYLIAGGLSGFPFLESMKYPPSLYFSSYGMFCSSLLYLLLSRNPGRIRNSAVWISKNCMDLYLAHIFVYYLGTWKIESPWIQFALLSAGSFLIVYAAETIRKAVKTHR